MSTQEIESAIVELNALRLQRRLWRVSALVCVLAITVACLLVLRNSAARLLESGPAHDEFVAQLNREMTRQIFPRKYEISVGFPVEMVPSLRTAMPLDQTPVPAVSDGARTICEPAEADKADTISQACAESRSKILARFREQTVAEYQSTVTKIIDDLTAIRQAEGGNASGGLPVNTVAILLIARVQDAKQKQSLEHRAWVAGQGTSEDAE